MTNMLAEALMPLVSHPIDITNDPNIVAIGATPNNPRPIGVWSTSPEDSQRLLEQREPALKGQVDYLQAAPLTVLLPPAESSGQSLKAALFEALAAIGVTPFTVFTDEPLWGGGGGTVGCALRDIDNNRYYLTAGHLVAPHGGIFSVQDPIHVLGPLLRSSTVFSGTGLDWALVKGSPMAHPDSTIRWSQTGLALTGPVSAAQLSLLQGKTITMGGGQSQMERSGTVQSVDATVYIRQDPANPKSPTAIRSHQILVASLPNALAFGEAGDSGAVAYTLGDTGVADGLAVGLYWATDQQTGNHVLTPLSALLTEIGGGLSLW